VVHDPRQWLAWWVVLGGVVYQLTVDNVLSGKRRRERRTQIILIRPAPSTGSTGVEFFLYRI